MFPSTRTPLAEAGTLQSAGIGTSIGITDNGVTVAFAREPGFLMHGQEQLLLDTEIPLGIMLFSQNAGAGIACASCHPEGQDDGHTWQFEGLGARRTQNLSGGVASRAPFHWDGEFADLQGLMDDVFTERMGGEALRADQVATLTEWLDGIGPERRTPEEPTRVERGRELFVSPEVGCATCHNGPQLTDNALHTVVEGTIPTKTPSLLGVGLRAPYMHTGCAPTLEDRFTDPACGGGDLHGTTSQLDGRDIGALVAYLQTL